MAWLWVLVVCIALHYVAGDVRIPEPVTDVSAQPLDGGAVISFTPAAADSFDASGFGPLRFSITLHSASDGITLDALPIVVAASPAYIVGRLTNGVTYTFQVSASNFANELSAPTLSNTVQVGAPQSPASLVARARDGGAHISWQSPRDNAAPVTSYTVATQHQDGTQLQQVVTGSPPLTFVELTGLVNFDAYSFTVHADNSVGSSPTALSNTVFPQGSATPQQQPNVNPTSSLPPTHQHHLCLCTCSQHQ